VGPPLPFSQDAPFPALLLTRVFSFFPILFSRRCAAFPMGLRSVRSFFSVIPFSLPNRYLFPRRAVGAAEDFPPQLYETSLGLSLSPVSEHGVDSLEPVPCARQAGPLPLVFTADIASPSFCLPERSLFFFPPFRSSLRDPHPTQALENSPFFWTSGDLFFGAHVFPDPL